MLELIPSILSNSPEAALKMLMGISKSNNFKRVQVDFVDGKYATNLTIKPHDLDLQPWKNLKFDAHLMVTESNLQMYFEAVSSMKYDRIITQLESISHPEKFTGLAIDIHSPLSVIEPYLYNLQVVVVMSVEPGLGGQKFIESAVEKVRKLSNLRILRNLSYKVCVDGGVEKTHLEILESAGADEVVAGAEKVLEW